MQKQKDLEQQNQNDFLSSFSGEMTSNATKANGTSSQ